MAALVLLDDVTYRSLSVDDYRYAVTLEPISLIPIRDRRAMNKAVVIKGRRFGRGAILTNDLSKATEVVNGYGGYLYDLEKRSKVAACTNGSKLINWNISDEVSHDKNMFFGATVDGVRVIHVCSSNSEATMIRYYLDIEEINTAIKNGEIK